MPYKANAEWKILCGYSKKTKETKVATREGGREA